jgi:hypothetical protein
LDSAVGREETIVGSSKINQPPKSMVPGAKPKSEAPEVGREVRKENAAIAGAEKAEKKAPREG